MGIVSMFPKSWRTDVVVLRGGGRDAKGNPLPVQELPATGCLIGDQHSADGVGFTDVVDHDAVLFRDPGFEFHATDRIRTPNTSLMPGNWQIVGRPFTYPLGTVVRLKGI
ncbi:hypothetical protein ACSVHC_08960 [Arthrobacter sp. KNU-44]|uniref:hypothetical protein n=1 Tax=Arthrobacter sp. KNU-44 TaxID=3450744 RepID=UPI003F428D86